MRSRWLVLGAMLLMAAGAAAQITGDVIGMHDLGPGSKSPITGARPDFCLYCHAPHTSLVAGTAPLWNQKLTNQSFTPYTSSTYHQKGNGAQTLGADSNLCLSCHDGTVAVGATAAYGQITTTGSMYANDVFMEGTSTALQASHPFSLILPINDATNLVSTLSSGKTGDPTGVVKLVNGNIECTSCHNPHVQAKDPLNQNFLVKDSSNGSLCYACHDPNRVAAPGQDPNPLNGWYQSIHAISSAQVQNLPYATLGANACFSCHTDHNAPGAQWLQRGRGDQVCLNCHSGSSNTTNTSTGRHVMLPPSLGTLTAKAPQLNIAQEYAKIGHPLLSGDTTLRQPTGTNSKAALQKQGIRPNTPSQSGCVDCHDPHAVQTMTTFSSGPQVRPDQVSVEGVSEKDSTTLLKPAKNQYETCFRCHGSSTGKAPDLTRYGYMPLRLSSTNDQRNLIPQFSVTAISSHPVTHPRRSPLPQPSLLNYMWDLNGTTHGRSLGNQILCTDCHNSDDNREFGGKGPAGPHGSKWTHILERRYEFSRSVAPGQPVTNLYPNPDLSVNGPYAMCAKCHNLSNIMQNASFKHHSSHLMAGFSCSTCHTAHGMSGASSNVSGERLVNFDINVVGPNGGVPIAYNRGTNTCTLTCHQVVHNPDGTVKSTKMGVLKK